MVNIDIAAATARYIAGESINALAKELGISNPTLKTRLQAAGVRIRSRKVAARIRSKPVTPPANSADNELVFYWQNHAATYKAQLADLRALIVKVKP